MMNQQPDYIIGNVLREFINDSTVGICLIDIKGLIQEVNPAFCQITGYSREELLNRPIKDIEHKEAGDKLENHRVEILTLGEASYPSVYRGKDGQAVKTQANVCEVGLDGHQFRFIFIK